MVKRKAVTFSFFHTEWEAILAAGAKFAAGNEATRTEMLMDAAEAVVDLSVYELPLTDGARGRIVVKAIFPAAVPSDPTLFVPRGKSSRPTGAAPRGRVKHSAYFSQEELACLFAQADAFASMTIVKRIDYLAEIADAAVALPRYNGEMTEALVVRWAAKIFAPTCIQSESPKLIRGKVTK